MSGTSTVPAAPPRRPQGRFDYRGALAAGYSPKELADHLAASPQPGDIDVAAARQAGYSDDEIISHETQSQPGGVREAIKGVVRAVVPGSIQRGYAHAVEGLANTADVFGATETGQDLHNSVDRKQLDAPTSAAAVQQAWHDGEYGKLLSNLPGAVGEAVPQLGAAVLGAGGGAMVGTAIGGPAGGAAGFVAGAGADAIVGVAFQAGDIAKARAKADGRDTPNEADIAAAIGSSAILGAMDRVGLGRAAGSLVAGAVKRLVGGEAAGTVATSLGAVATHGASDAAQSIGQQLAETTGTAQGATVNPDAIVTQGIIGAGSRVALGGARTIQDHITGQAVVDAAARQATQDRTDWSTMAPEEQARLHALAGAGQAMTAIQDRATGDTTPAVAARTALRERTEAVRAFVDHMASDDVGLLDQSHVQSIRRAVQDASRPGETLTADHLDTIDALPLPERERYGLMEALGQINLLSNPANMQPVGGPVSQAFGLAGNVAVGAAHFKGLPAFIIRPVVNYLATQAGAGLDRLIGADQPRLRADSNRAAAMLAANGVKVPDTIDGLRQAISQSQDAIQATATVLGLNPDHYGPGAAERRAMSRAVQSDTPGATITQASIPKPMSVAEAVALARSEKPLGTPQEAAQTQSAPSGSAPADAPNGASTESLGGPGAMSGAEPSMLTMPPPPPSSHLMAQRLPRWQWVMGNKVQQDLMLAGTPRNLNYSREAAQTIGQLHDAGIIDAPMRDRLLTYDGQILPRGFFNLVRQQWLLNHGIDRRTLAAQQAGTKPN